MTPREEIDAELRDALARHQADDLISAEAAYRAILTRDAGHVGALRLLGALCAQTNRHAEALEHLSRAIAIAPGDAESHYNFAATLASVRRRDEAIAALRTAIALQPAFAEAHNNLGGLLRDAGKIDDAIVACRAAIAIRPDYPEALVNLGALLRESRPDEAIVAARRAIALRPAHAAAHHLLAQSLADRGEFDAALVAGREALRLAPNDAGVCALLSRALKEVGRIDESIAAARRAVALRPDDASLHSDLLLALHYDPKSTPASLLAEHRAWAARHTASVERFDAHGNDRDPDRRLRVGFVSSDFRRHPVGRFLVPLLTHLDRSRVETICYDHSPRADDVTATLRDSADGWRSIATLDDDAAARQIRDDRVDVLIDLTMHAARGRPLLFARRPAPVQATWLAYNSTTGLDAIDWRLSDPYFDPPGTDGDYVERTLRLPQTYWCYPAPAEAGDVAPSPAMTKGRVTFGCLNSFSKVSDASLALWRDVLRAVPTSRLLLHAPEGSARRRVLAALGVPPDRISFVARMTTGDYFARYREIDVALDPTPYAGGTTTCDALWQGVPVVTLAGRTGVGRAGASVLANVGLHELVATTADDYVRVAASLASDVTRLAELRATMHERMRASPLMDAAAFAHDIEAAFRTMWRAWCER